MTVIDTPRLTLRPLEPADMAVIVDCLSDYSVCRNLARVPYPYHMSDAKAFLDFVGTLDERSAVRAITLRDNPLGLIGIISHEYSEAKQNSELGYWLSVPFWGQGYATEAADALVTHAFAKSALEAMVACYFDDNPASGKILRRVGFEDVGACLAFSKAQGIDVPVTNMRLTRTRFVECQKASA